MAERIGKGAGGRGTVAHYAPESAVALDALEATVWRVADANLVDLTAQVCAVGARDHPGGPTRPRLGREPVGRDATRASGAAFGDLTDAQCTALAFAEQFCVDVSAIGDSQRSALQAALGDDAMVYAQVLYVTDVLPRARFVLDRLFGTSTPSAEVSVGPTPLSGTGWRRSIRVVPGLLGLDPVTTELIRLRGARQHQCRICQSRRSLSAMVAGADEDTFDAIDFYATSDLSDAHKAALAFTDAFIWTPGRMTDEVVDGLRAHYSPGPAGGAGARPHPQRDQQMRGRHGRRRRQRDRGLRDLRCRARRDHHGRPVPPLTDPARRTSGAPLRRGRSARWGRSGHSARASAGTS